MKMILKDVMLFIVSVWLGAMAMNLYTMNKTPVCIEVVPVPSSSCTGTDCSFPQKP